VPSQSIAKRGGPRTGTQIEHGDHQFNHTSISMQFKQPIEETWKPYLDGKGTHDEAFAELIKRTGEAKQ
jgi:hypothetical protein